MSEGPILLDLGTMGISSVLGLNKISVSRQSLEKTNFIQNQSIKDACGNKEWLEALYSKLALEKEKKVKIFANLQYSCSNTPI